MSLNDKMTALMDKVRQITGLTDKISVAQLTDLMSNFVSPNLIPNTSENWQNFANGWNILLCYALPVSKGETISIGSEFSNCTGKFTLGVLCLDEDKNGLTPNLDKDGNFPLSTGNISNSYIIEKDGFTNESSLRKLTVTIQANNCKYLNIFIASFDSTGALDFRKVMAVRGPQLLPWTPLYIVGGEGSSTQPASSASGATSSASLQATQSASSATQSIQLAASPATR